MMNDTKRDSLTSLYDVEVRDSLELFASQRLIKEGLPELDLAMNAESEDGDASPLTELVSPSSAGTTSVETPTVKRSGSYSPLRSGSYSPSRQSAKRMQKKKQKYRDIISPAKERNLKSKHVDALSSVSDHTPRATAPKAPTRERSSSLSRETSASNRSVRRQKTKKTRPGDRKTGGTRSRSPVSERMSPTRYTKRQLPVIDVGLRLSETKMAAVAAAADVKERNAKSKHVDALSSVSDHTPRATRSRPPASVSLSPMRYTKRQLPVMDASLKLTGTKMAAVAAAADVAVARELLKWK